MRALVVGHTGQDGTLLCNDLLRKGISILGISSSKVYSSEGTALSRPPNILNYNEISEVIRTFRPAEIYYLPAPIYPPVLTQQRLPHHRRVPEPYDHPCVHLTAQLIQG